MHLQNFLLALAPLVAPAAAECFGTGMAWSGTESSARGAVEYWCQYAPSKIGGVFYPSDRKHRCSILKLGEVLTNKHVDLTIEWLGKFPTTLNENDCVKRLNEDIDGCARGGSKTNGDWKFTSDPNAGVCPEKPSEDSM